MGFFKKLIFVIVLIIALGIALLYTFGRGIEKASIEDVKINPPSEFTLQGFTLSGTLYIKNPSELSVPIKQIDLDLILKETNEHIASATISSFTLTRNATTPIPFTQQIGWVPSTNLALDLITKDTVIVLVKGSLKIDIPKIEEYAIPFQTEIDLKPYVQSIADEYLDRDTQKQIQQVVNDSAPLIRDTIPVVQDAIEQNRPLIEDAINQTTPLIEEYLNQV